MLLWRFVTSLNIGVVIKNGNNLHLHKHSMRPDKIFRSCYCVTYNNLWMSRALYIYAVRMLRLKDTCSVTWKLRHQSHLLSFHFYLTCNWMNFMSFRFDQRETRSLIENSPCSNPTVTIHRLINSYILVGRHVRVIWAVVYARISSAVI